MDEYSPLVMSARLTLDAEFPDVPTAYQVLSAIGSDDTARPGFNNILSAISDPAERKRAETATTRALRTLTETKGLIERELPAWALQSSKLRHYRITDPYLRFWFRYVERQVDRVARGRSDLAIAHFDRDWSIWRGRSIEPVVRAALQRLAVSDDNLAGVESVQPWWVRDGSVEVDVVTAQELDELRRHRDRVPKSDDALLATISPGGSPPRGADLAYTAADLLSAWG